MLDIYRVYEAYEYVEYIDHIVLVEETEKLKTGGFEIVMGPILGSARDRLGIGHF